MTRFIYIFFSALISFLLVMACNNSYMGLEQVKVDSVRPDRITVNEVIPKSGALEIFFTLPEGHPDIEQIIANYTNKQGREMEFKVSRYSSSILIEGFIGTDEVTINLVCVDTSGNESEVTKVKTAALPSPVEVAFNTLKAEPAFGGVRVDWQNSEANQLVIHVLTEDTLEVGKSSLVEDINRTIYSNDSTNTYSYIRSYPSTEHQFAFVISDKWGNYSDTLFTTIIPYKEEALDYRIPEAVPYFNSAYQSSSRDYDLYGVDPITGIQNDGNSHAAWAGPHTIFDGLTTTNQFYIYKFVKNYTDPDPVNHVLIQNVYSTYDLNVDIRLSRVKIIPRPASNWAYKSGSVKRFRIWGTDDTNTDRWTRFPADWTLIGEYDSPVPVTPNNPTQEEINLFYQGFEYTINDDNLNPDARPNQSLRYMRIEMLESYDPLSRVYLFNELEMWGDILNQYK